VSGDFLALPSEEEQDEYTVERIVNTVKDGDGRVCVVLREVGWLPID
jgi:hypothetical protein